VVVNLHAKQAHVVFKGHTYNLQQTDESDGQKYTDGAIVWRNKDDVGTLQIRRQEISGRRLPFAKRRHRASDTAASPSLMLIYRHSNR
jgi:hypothetical protein